MICDKPRYSLPVGVRRVVAGLRACRVSAPPG